MPNGGLLGTIWRRKLLVILGCAASVALGLLAGRYVGPSYSSRAVVVLLPPAPSRGPEVANPYLYLGGIQQARDVVLQSLTSQGTREAVARKHPSATYDVQRDPMSDGPLLVLTTTAPTKAATMSALRTVLGLVSPTVQRLQHQMGVSRGAQITPLTVTSDKEPTVVLKGELRAGIGAGVLVAGIFAVAISLLDPPLTRRAERRRAARQSAKSEEQGSEPSLAPGARPGAAASAKPEPGRAARAAPPSAVTRTKSSGKSAAKSVRRRGAGPARGEAAS